MKRQQSPSVIFLIAIAVAMPIICLTKAPLSKSPRLFNFQQMALPAKLLKTADESKTMDNNFVTTTRTTTKKPETNSSPESRGDKNVYDSDRKDSYVLIGRSRSRANRLRKLRQKTKPVMLTAQGNDKINDAIKTFLAWRNLNQPIAVDA